MANVGRPKKRGIDYFSLDVMFDPKMEIIIAKKGIESLGVIVRIWQHIYKHYGYYMPYNEDELFLIRKECGRVTYLELESIIDEMIDKNMFDKEIFKEHKILTSKRLQNNFETATRTRKPKPIITKEYVISYERNTKETNISHESVTKVKNKVNNSILNNTINTFNTSVEKKNEKEKKRIPFKEIIEYLNLKTKQNLKHTTKNTQKYIKTRWNEGFVLEDFYKVIDNAYIFRMENGGDLTYMRPSTLFNGQFENRLSGSSYGWKENDNSKPKETVYEL